LSTIDRIFGDDRPHAVRDTQLLGAGPSPGLCMDPERFSREALAALPKEDREGRLREMEVILNARLADPVSLNEFQDRLYAVIDDLHGRLGHFLGRWDYGGEVEYWGGKSYMNPAIPDELLLKSTFRSGVELRWGDSEFPSDRSQRTD
jgi:hypothetical protein